MGCGCNKKNKVVKGIVKKNNGSALTEKQKQILKRKRKLISIQATSHPKVKNQ